MSTSGFTDEQTDYLKAFISGLTEAAKLPHLGQDADGRFTHEEEETAHGTPVDELSREELIQPPPTPAAGALLAGP